MWDVILDEPISVWKSDISVRTLETHMEREHRNTCPTKEKYKGIFNTSEGFYFNFMSMKFEGFTNAWCAAVCRDYAYVRVHRQHSTRHNFGKHAFMDDKGIFVSTSLETAIDWDDLVFLSIAKTFIASSKERPSTPCSVCKCVHFKSNIVTQCFTRKRTFQELLHAQFGTRQCETIRYEVHICKRCLRDKNLKDFLSKMA